MKKVLLLVPMLVVALCLMFMNTPVQAGILTTQTTMKFSPVEPFMVGQVVPLTASVASNGAPAQGKVGFIFDTVEIAEGTLDSNGRVVFHLSMPIGTHPVRARY